MSEVLDYKSQLINIMSYLVFLQDEEISINEAINGLLKQYKSMLDVIKKEHSATTGLCDYLHDMINKSLFDKRTH